MTKPIGISDLTFELHMLNGTTMFVTPLWGERYYQFFMRIMNYEGVDFVVVRRKPEKRPPIGAWR